MKAKNSENEFVPRALREVWEWKDSIQREVQHLPLDQALHEIMRMAHEAAVAQGAIPAAATKVAEGPGKYGKKQP